MAGRRCRFLLHPFGDLREIARVAEVLVDAGEANVGDVIERTEAGHDRLADSGRRNLVPLGFKPALDAADQPIDLVRIDIALAGRVADRTGKLVAVKRLTLAIFLDHGEIAQLDSLEG